MSDQPNPTTSSDPGTPGREVAGGNTAEMLVDLLQHHAPEQPETIERGTGPLPVEIKYDNRPGVTWKWYVRAVAQVVGRSRRYCHGHGDTLTEALQDCRNRQLTMGR